MNRVPLYILAGGQSSRFGSDKARAMLEGEPLICRVRRLAEPVRSCVTVVADRAGKYADLGLRTIADRRGGLGPLAGLQTALMDLEADQKTTTQGSSGTDSSLSRGSAGVRGRVRGFPDRPQRWLLLCSCDAVVIRPHWLRQLLEARQEQVDAVAMRGSGRWQPMPGLYARSALPHVENQLRGNRRSMQQLLDQLRTTALPLPADWPDRWQVNTPADLERHRSSH